MYYSHAAVAILPKSWMLYPPRLSSVLCCYIFYIFFFTRHLISEIFFTTFVIKLIFLGWFKRECISISGLDVSMS